MWYICGRRECYRGLVWNEGDHLYDPGIDGRALLKWIFSRGWEGVDQIYLVLHRMKIEVL
jgi:hypothetical protein